MKLFHIAAADLRRVGKIAEALDLATPDAALAMAYVFGKRAPARRGPGDDVVSGHQPGSTDELSSIFLDQLREDGYNVDLESPATQQDLKTKWPYGVVTPLRTSAPPFCAAESIKIPLIKGDAAARQVRSSAIPFAPSHRPFHPYRRLA